LGAGLFTEALQRLVDLYLAWGKPDETAKWQLKLDGAKVGEATDDATQKDEAAKDAK
jgi:hypothetical protein